MKASSKLSVVLIVLLEAAQGGGMKKKRAKSIYEEFLAHYENMREGFSEVLLEEVAKALVLKTPDDDWIIEHADELKADIPVEALVFVNGEQVEPSYRLLANDTVEFVKQYGEKSILDPDEKAQIDRIEAMLARLVEKPADHESPKGIITTASTTSGSVAFGPIRVNPAESEVTVYDKTFPVDDVLLAVITCLVEANGNWITRTDMKSKSRILQDEDRLDRIIIRLTKTIKSLASLLDSSPRGYRIVIPMNGE